MKILILLIRNEYGMKEIIGIWYLFNSKIIENEKFYKSKTITRLMLKNVIKSEKSLEA